MAQSIVKNLSELVNILEFCLLRSIDEIDVSGIVNVFFVCEDVWQDLLDSLDGVFLWDSSQYFFHFSLDFLEGSENYD